MIGLEASVFQSPMLTSDRTSSTETGRDGPRNNPSLSKRLISLGAPKLASLVIHPKNGFVINETPFGQPVFWEYDNYGHLCFARISEAV